MTPADFGATCFLQSPTVVDPTATLYFDDTLSEASDINYPCSGGKDFGSTDNFPDKTNDELYGFKRFDNEAFERELYFGLALEDSMHDLGDFA